MAALLAVPFLEAGNAELTALVGSPTRPRLPHVTVECHWAGGSRTRTEIRRPLARLNQLSDYDALLTRVAELRRAGCIQRVIAAKLNEEGWRSARHRPGFTRGMVSDLLRRQGLVARRQLAPADHIERQENEMTILELAERLGMPHQTLFAWVRQGKVQGRLSTVSSYRIWLLKVDDAELDRLKKLRECSRPSGRSPRQIRDT
ncbi:transposase [Azospirillum canadense]|uniref:transposase n=1 Tax=Azospirillum canadense TaxID=403962 RepID=UPI00222614CD|nr:transposase [Azospirillum canadense]MCW2241604.1 transposase-like protein [Azospirillum canadense]